MLNLLTLPVLGLLLAFPSLPGWGTIKKLREKPAAPLDSLPPTWFPAYQLALRDSFVQAALPPLGPDPIGLRVQQDPRRLRVSFDPDSGTITTVPELGTVAVGESPRMSLDEYKRDLTRRNFRRLWAERSRMGVNSMAGVSASATPTTGFQFAIPVTMPRAIQGILGPGGPALNVSGTENIKLSGTSEWTNQQTTLLGAQRSWFPSLDMQQDLDIRLEGQLSDRVKVNLLQNSANQIPLANRIAINYKGDEDDLVQALDLGNTNLTLPGTQFVSYSGKNEGLFGMKATTRMGPLDFTLLASKQEGRSERASYSGGASRSSYEIRDKDYVHGQYFFLYNPSAATGLRAIDEQSIRVYLDEGLGYSNQVNLIRGRAFVDPATADTVLDGIPAPGPSDTTRSLRGNYRLLVPGAEGQYELLPYYGSLFLILRLRTPLSSASEQRLGVTYRYKQVDINGQPVGDSLRVGSGEFLNDVDGVPGIVMQLIRPPQRLLTVGPDGVYASADTTPFNATREFELRNVYQLPGQGIDPRTFELNIEKGFDDPPRYNASLGIGTVPYVELLGLDNFDETSGTPVPGHDAKVDGTAPNSQFATFVDFTNGVLFFHEPRPFAPRLGPSGPLFDQFISTLLSRRDSLVGAPGTENAANPDIYDKQTVLDQDVEYTINVSFTASRIGNEITLGRSNIVEGSEVVMFNNERLVVNKDYTIDYDLGRISLIRQPGPNDQVNIDYAYAPLFQQAGKTLLGSAFRYDGRDKSFGGAFLYESRGAQDLRPRIGEEPSRTVIGDLNADWRMRPEWMTRMVDALPGVRTTAGSEMNVSAEVGMSFPNPNTQNEVFIDDMEGVRDGISLSMGPERWRWSSVPRRNATQNIEEATPPQRNAEVHWFTPLTAIKERELKPNLTDAQGAQNAHQVLAISLPRRPTGAPPTDRLWAGLTQPLDAVGIDMTRSQFIEIWVNDFNDVFSNPRTDGVKLNIDLGVVSEDQKRAPNIPANNRMDSEDFNQDDQLQVTGRSEDTGPDSLLSESEVPKPPGTGPGFAPDLSTVTGADPEGDDFQLPDEDLLDLNPRKWLYTNGLEANKTVTPFPDTEDLNLNDNLDLDENYFRYTIDLSDPASPYLVTDIQRDFVQAGIPNYVSNNEPIPLENGWRRYRIPIGDEARLAIGNPRLDFVRHVRVWLEDVIEVDPLPYPALPFEEDDGRPYVMIGGLEIVGSRWLAAVDPDALVDGTTLTLNSVNTIDNADIYVPPFDPGRTRSGSQELVRREQSLAFEFTDFGQGDTLEAFKTFSIDEDYSRYGALNWYTASFEIPGYDASVEDSIRTFIRFASDEKGLNYYEVNSPLPPSSSRGAIQWDNVKLTLTDISNLKLNADFPKQGEILYRQAGVRPRQEFVIKGRPSFTRIRRISFGLMNRSNQVLASGQVWSDEVRATDVVKESGRAQRLVVTGNMSNLFSYNFSYNDREADFASVGETRGTGNTTAALNFSTSFNLHRFFEATGIVMPVNLSYSNNRMEPRFTAGDDVVRTGALADASVSQSISKNWSTNYVRSWSDRSNPLLLYTLGGITASYQASENESNQPTLLSKSNNSSAAVNYSISPRKLAPIPLPLTKGKLWPLPQRFYWNYGVANNRNTSFSRERDSTGTLKLLSSTVGRAAVIDFGATTQPIDMLTHNFTAHRNLSLPEPLLETVGPFNLGRVTNWRQSIDSRYTVNRLSQWIRPNMSWTSNYVQNNGPELSPDLSVKAITNGQSFTVTWDLPFNTLAQRAATTSRPPPPQPGVPDSARLVPVKPKGPPVWRTLLARLGPVSTDAAFDKSSGFTRIRGVPTPAYLFGVTSDPGLSDTTGRITPLFGNRADDSFNWRFSGRTTLDLGLGASLSTRGSFNARQINSNAVVTRSNRSEFPSVEVRYGRIAEAIGLRRLLLNPQLATSYSRSQTVEFANSEEATMIATRSAWQPLIRIQGELKNGTRTEMRIERSVTRTENRQLGVAVTTDRNTDVNLNVNRSYTQGQKVNILGKESTVRTSVDLGFSAVYSRRSGETLQQGRDLPQNVVENDRLSVNARGAYGFSSNVTGNLELGFLQSRDLQREIVTRSIRVELRAQFTF